VSNDAANDEASTAKAVEAIYAYAAELMVKGESAGQIEKALIEKGLDAEAARIVVNNLVEARAKAHREAGQKNMLYGGLWFIGGTVITVGTYQAAEGGAWGAIIFGAIQFFRGLIQASQHS
jgi:hypothetical protein